jgi:hypothetical protein
VKRSNESEQQAHGADGGMDLAHGVLAGGYAMPAKKTLPKLIQEAIDKGATTVEEIHKSIVDLPLKILEESDLLRGPSKEARRVQDHTIGAIYDVIRDVNEQVGTLASDLLAARRANRVGKSHKSRSTAGHARKH